MMNKKEWFLKERNHIYCFADNIDICRKLLKAGARIIQFRNKTMGNHVFYNTAKQMQSLIRSYKNVIFIVNDRVDIALQLNADGVHIGTNDPSYKKVVKETPKDMIIGISVDNEKEAAAAENTGATYIGAGSVFPSKTKKNAPVIGIAGLQKIVHAVHIPVVAIGGISPDNLIKVKKTGIQYLGIISAINDSPDIQTSLKNMIAIMNRG
jgi:thiamine-phosphate pyrophosphorylase